MAIYRRKNDPKKLWHYRKRVKLPDGSRVRIAGTPAINTVKAAEEAERAHIELVLNPPPAPIASIPTVTEYAAKWIESRRGRVATVDEDEARLRLHVLPHIGHMRLDEVKPRHARDLVFALRAEGVLAPRSILMASATMHSMFKSAKIEELILANPIEYEAGVLPKKADKDPEWRHKAIYTRDEVQAMLSDDRIPPDRRMLYGLKMLGALRHGESAALTWRQIDTTITPLGCINLGKTKSGVPRAVPIHPTLAKMLATWKLAGWFNTFGRQPKPEDLVVPTLTMSTRAAKEAQEALVADLALLGFTTRAGKRMNRRGHDLRRSFASLAQADGARKDIIEWGTHGPRGDIMSMYTSLPWASICEEWAKLKIVLLEGALITMEHSKPSAMTLRARKRWAPRGHETARAVANGSQASAVVSDSLVTPSRLELEFSA